MMKFEYICRAKTGKISEFSIFANIKSQTDDSVTLERYMKFGNLKTSDNTMSIEDFKRFYERIEEVYKYDV